MPTQFFVKTSTVANAGQGLFAKTPLVEGDEFSVEGILVARHSLMDRLTRYADAYKFRVGRFLLIPLSKVSMMNHSATPNVVKVIRGRLLFFRTLRSVGSGEELFFCYSRFAQNRFYKNKRKST